MLMLKDITTIKCQGAYFTTPTVFTFFDPLEGNKIKTIKGALLYGRNGTGKSTIAKAFRKIKGEDIPSLDSVITLDDTSNVITISEEEKNRIYVFDEDFVDNNVRLQEDHLETIVMLGEAANLTAKIEEAEAKRDKAKSDYENKYAIYKKYLDYNNPQSPKYYFYRIGNALRGDDCWAGRDKLIKGARQNTQVRDDTYKQFLEVTPNKSKSELIVDFEEQMKALENAESGSATINIAVPSLSESYTEYDDAGLKKLLAEKIEKPDLTDREKYLLELVEEGKSTELSQRIVLFRREETITCPYCLQDISPEYKADLLSSIEKVLSKKVDAHQESLYQKIQEEIAVDLSPYKDITGYEECISLIEKINTLIRSNNNLINLKNANPYNPIETEETIVADLSIKLNAALEELEKERIVHNDEATKSEPIKKELTRINGEIAHYDVIDLAEQYEKQLVECAAAKEEIDALKQAWDDSEKDITNLEAQRSNVQLALDAINSCMKYIFFSEDRLRIEYEDGVYKLVSHGKSVKPRDVSVGERNIIGLSYFFTRVMEGKDEKDAYNQEYLLIIDDPVSSYDAENRIGILSFLKYKLGEFLEGNVNTKALVMTHDLSTFYDIDKELQEIVESCKSKGYANPPIVRRFELSNQTISPFKYRHRHEYTELLERIYKYARNEAGEDELIIGNMMRQVVEAFSTFQYKKSIEDVSTDPQILALLNEAEYISYFRNLMYRLVLHGGSHREEQVKSMKDFSFFSLISDEEKKRTARDILCFIYLLNERHLLIHLSNCKDVEATLHCWCQEIKANAAVI